MSAREPRFEVVRSDAGWFARFVAANGRKVWQTEVYERRAKAVRAVELIGGYPVFYPSDSSREAEILTTERWLAVREVDERTP